MAVLQEMLVVRANLELIAAQAGIHRAATAIAPGSRGLDTASRRCRRIDFSSLETNQ
jgi:hypothetical protein